jgi:hypothetical protein
MTGNATTYRRNGMGQGMFLALPLTALVLNPISWSILSEKNG